MKLIYRLRLCFKAEFRKILKKTAPDNEWVTKCV